MLDQVADGSLVAIRYLIVSAAVAALYLNGVKWAKQHGKGKAILWAIVLAAAWGVLALFVDDSDRVETFATIVVVVAVSSVVGALRSKRV
jgi:hypothetical protein